MSQILGLQIKSCYHYFTTLYKDVRYVPPILINPRFRIKPYEFFLRVSFRAILQNWRCPGSLEEQEEQDRQT